ncbi:glycosyltransferase family 4 protein [Sphingomonas sp. LY54]|uniref:glycosyltransferase family 4 protein n=1 Tax=Sphingomonas sp. LY54 TaxID=3095343 RepID=UPI002D796E47|nr:glycosyltransferase family 4 protein [Sphingomonas sp. LY54]WRP27575.1 glycosyltransferase family 4 protein [Sphingomonas sp. LY54]
MRRQRLVISINSSWNFVNFRAGLIRGLVDQGYEVVAVAPEDAHSARIAELGARFVALPMDGRGTSPRKDAALFAGYLKILRAERPAAFLGYTIKPNIYGSLAAGLLGIPTINNVAGLGTAFLQRNWLNRTVRILYKTALRRAEVIFFQNPDDRDLFVGEGLVPPGVADLLPGSGVDTRRFAPMERPTAHSGRVFLLVARMLWAKGVAEFVEAARDVRARFPDARFQVLGIVDETSKGAIDRATIERWAAEGAIEFLGSADDVRPHLAAANCIVLPTYYPEGTPRSLLEAAAMGKPLLATDVPGCRQIVDHGRNGFLVPPRDARALADAMARFCTLSDEAVALMGAASRERAEKEFDERIVIDRYIAAIRRTVGS